MFQLEPSVITPAPIDITDFFIDALRDEGLHVENVNPTYQTQNLSGPISHEIHSKEVKDIGHVINELVKVRPYVVFVREIIEHPSSDGQSKFIVRFDFIARLYENE